MVRESPNGVLERGKQLGDWPIGRRGGWFKRTVTDAEACHEHFPCGALEWPVVRVVLNDQVGFECTVVLVQLPHVNVVHLVNSGKSCECRCGSPQFCATHEGALPRRLPPHIFSETLRGRQGG